MTLRDETEWVELIEHGLNYLAEATAEPIYNAYKKLMETKLDVNIKLYCDGKAGARIANIFRSQ